MPNIDFMRAPIFQDEVDNIKGTPDVMDAPAAPTDFRSDADWDAAAIRLRTELDGLVVPRSTPVPDFDGEFEALKADATGYQRLDPLSGVEEIVLPPIPEPRPER